MSNTYQLTAEIHNLINQINQKKGKELRVQSDYEWAIYSTGADLLWSKDPCWEALQCDSLPALNPENIQRLLCELDLEDCRNKKTSDMVDSMLYALDFKPRTLAKATPSLWNSGEEGQIQVLTELKEVLKNYLNN